MFSLDDALRTVNESQSDQPQAGERAEAEAAVASLDNMLEDHDNHRPLLPNGGADRNAPATPNTTAATGKSASPARAVPVPVTQHSPSPVKQQNRRNPALAPATPDSPTTTTTPAPSLPSKPVLRGVLAYVDENGSPVVGRAAAGRKRYLTLEECWGWSRKEESSPQQGDDEGKPREYSFVLRSDVTDTDPGIFARTHRPFFDPPAGRKIVFSGHFEAPRFDDEGVASVATRKVREPSVKIEFRDLGRWYRIQGSGTNPLGSFSLNGTARWSDDWDGYRVEMRKTYLGDMEDNNDRSSNGSSNTSSSSKVSRNHSQSTSTPTSTLASASTPARVEPVRVKTEPLSPPKTMVPESSTAQRSPPPPSPPRQRDDRSQRQQTRETPASQKRQQKQQQQTPPPSRKPRSSFPPPNDDDDDDDDDGNDPETNPRHRHVQLPPSLASSLHTSFSQVDRVNGRGMWHAWTRSFDTPLLALLDLFDNAVDASWTLLPGGKAIGNTGANDANDKPKIRVDMDTIGRNGVVIRNASAFIPPLKQVLQVYKSSKVGAGDNSIGENGIGVKHACASLSSLSLVFTKTTDESAGGTVTLSMGILMQDLQRDDGIVLPSMGWAQAEDDDVDAMEEHLMEMCDSHPTTWGRAIREYGEQSRTDGIDRCLEQLRVLVAHRDWRESPNVFSVVLTNLKHAALEHGDPADGNESSDSDDGGDHLTIAVGGVGSPVRARRNGNPRGSRNGNGNGNAVVYHEVRENGDGDKDEDTQRSLSLLNTLREKLPYLYLHLHDLDINVGGRPIESVYWERRLTELSKFELQISQTELWSKISRLRYSPSHVQSVYDVSDPSQTVRFFCGFDPYRCQNTWGLKRDNTTMAGGDAGMMSSVPGGATTEAIVGNNSSLKLYLYSRESGRLIKVQNDPRNEMGLTGGSTDFCQGLTVIVDDYHGTLPLNPTKQDTAYGHSKHGQIHAANLKEWTAAIVHFYWNYHKSRLGDSKNAVRAAVASTHSALEDAYRRYQQEKGDGRSRATVDKEANATSLVPLCRGSFITYEGVDFGISGHRGVQAIRVGKRARERVVPKIAHNEVIRLDEPAAALVLGQQRMTTPSTSSKKRSRHHPESLARATALEAVGGADFASDPSPAADSAAPQSKKLRSIHQHDTHARDTASAPVFEAASLAAQGIDPAAVSPETVQDLYQHLQRCMYQNSLLRQDVNKMRNEVLLQQSEIEKVRAIAAEERQKAQRLEALQKESATEAARLRTEIQTLRSAASQLPSSTGSDPTTERLKRELQIYRSRAEFYKKEMASKKAQIEVLQQERTRFEDRVQELEAAQLNGASEDLLQF